MIRIEGLKKSFGTKILLRGIDFHFPKGEKIALLGDNGAGKSTLLDLLIGQQTADDGRIILPQQTELGFLPQEPNPHPKETVIAECESGNRKLAALVEKMKLAITALEEKSTKESLHLYEVAEAAFRTNGGYSLKAKASAILTGLGFKSEQFETSPKNLSGGWRMRLELAKVFLGNPNFLILDEPTNHLDLPSLVWFESYLKGFEGTLLFVSHDHTLINRLATYTLFLNNGKITSYPGNYDYFQKTYEFEKTQSEATRSQLKKKQEHLQQFVDRFGSKATKAKQAQSRVKMIEKIKAAKDDIFEPTTERKVGFKIPEPLKCERILYTIENGSIGYKQISLSRGLQLQVERGQKIAVIGANGIGKSTLLKTIRAQVQPTAGTFTASQKTVVSYFAQDQFETLNKNTSIIENVLSQTDLGEPECRTLLGGFLFTGDDIFKLVKVLSGGEKSRVGLAIALAKKNNLLLLDEPTNHLDMKSIEALSQALQKYEGTVIFISHNRSFINRVCSHTFAMIAEGRSMLFEGNLDDYERLSALANFPNVLCQGNSEPKMRTNSERITEETERNSDRKNLRKKKNSMANQLKKIDADITRLNKQVEKIDDLITSCDQSDFLKLSELTHQKDSIEAQLSIMEADWLKVSESLDKLSH